MMAPNPYRGSNEMLPTLIANCARWRSRVLLCRNCGLIILSLLFSMLAACQGNPVRDIPIATPPMSEEEKQKLEGELDRLCQGNSTEEDLECTIKIAVDRMLDGLDPRYQSRPFFQKYRLGFVEIADIDRTTSSRLHKFITEKTKLVLYYEPIMRENFQIKDVQLDDLPYASNDQQLARELGESYGVDVILTGIATVSDNFVDITLRMTESDTGQIVGIGAAKIDNNAMLRQWFQDLR